MKRSTRIAIILAVAALAGIILLFLPPIPQPQEYHHFADQRAFLGIPNFLNFASNLPFILVGTWALWNLFAPRAKARPQFLEEREKWPWFFLFFGTFLTGFGSAYYHWEPSNESLVGDRLPMALIAMALLAAVISERIGVKAGLRWLGPLLIAGVLSVLYWAWGEQRGAGDLRPYGLVQFLPILLIPLLILLFPPRYTGTSGYVVALGWYLLAKVAEAWDRGLYVAGEIVSGHTLKHLIAAVALYWLYRMISRRQPVASLRAVTPAGRDLTGKSRTRRK